MDKNSFTLFETLLSIIILLVVIVGFSKYSYNDNFNEEFILLQRVENSYSLGNYDNTFTSATKSLKITINENIEKNINVKEIKFKNEKVELVKYEL